MLVMLIKIGGENIMSTAKILKWVTGGMEAFLGIPVLGGLVVVSTGWTILGVMLILHIVTLLFSANEKRDYASSVVGIVTSCIGWIPIIGMIMHIITGILLMVSAAKKDADMNNAY